MKAKLVVVSSLVLGLLLTGLQSSAFAENDAISVELQNQAEAVHFVMVGFNDQSINSIPDATGGALYRKRGDYRSSSWSERVTAEIASDYQLTKVTEWPMTEVGIHCAVFRVPEAQSLTDTLGRLGQDARVEIAQPMNFFKTQAKPNDDPYFKLQSNLQAMQIAQAQTQATGRHVNIAMIDTGVALDHPDLSGQISHSQNFAHENSPGYMHDKHGTAVAGVMIAKKDNGAGIIGVAPDAKLLAYKACWPDQVDDMAAICNTLTLAMALNAALKADVNIINMSLSGPDDPLLMVLLKKAIKKGVFVVAANPGIGHEKNSFPASLPDVISVASTDSVPKNTQLSTQGFSAPGEKVLTTLPDGRYDFISGSSIAAAEVSGVLALLLEIKSDLTLSEVKALLQKAIKADTKSIFAGINARLAMLALCETTKCSRNLALANALNTSLQ